MMDMFTMYLSPSTLLAVLLLCWLSTCKCESRSDYTWKTARERKSLAHFRDFMKRQTFKNGIKRAVVISDFTIISNCVEMWVIVKKEALKF